MIKRIALKSAELFTACFIVAIAMSYIECGLMFVEARKRDE